MGLRLGDPPHDALPWVSTIDLLDEARAEACAGAKLRAIRYAAEELGDALRAGPQVIAVRTIPVSDLVYPTKFAFQGAAGVPWPFVKLQHRCLFIQVRAGESTKNILFNPTDRESSRETPYFKRLLARVGRLEEWLARPFVPVEEALAKLGVRPADIDLIAFDHFHTQDLRVTLGTTRGDGLRPALSARFENAYLLAPRREWEDWDQLHPMQRAWFIEDGKHDVIEERVIFTDRDLALGEGCALVRTPGHTSGNQTLFVHARDGVFGCSENATCVDGWSPYESRIPGLRSFAREYDLEVVMNANTPELAAEQYTSMVLERSVVDRLTRAPAFVQMFPSSEIVPSALAPGLAPSVVLTERIHGVPTKTTV